MCATVTDGSFPAEPQLSPGPHFQWFRVILRITALKYEGAPALLRFYSKPDKTMLRSKDVYSTILQMDKLSDKLTE